MRPAEFSTENPPRPIDCVETKEYVNGLRRRIEVQMDSLGHLADQVLALKKEREYLAQEIDKQALDLGIKEGRAGPGWEEVLR